MIDFFAIVTDLPRERVLGGVFLEMDETESFTAFHRTLYRTEILWSPTTRIIMGQAHELVVGAFLLVVGKRNESNLVHADQLMILTRVARVMPGAKKQALG